MAGWFPRTAYYSFGEYDGVIILEGSEDKGASATILAAVPDHVKDIKTTTLLIVEDTMEALRKAGEVTYQAPSA